jgi:hypothetical protein
MEEQAYPFEEKAIKVHESNLALITKGVYNTWIGKSLQKLAKLVPARYDKPEETSDVVGSLDTYIYEIDSPVLAALPDSESGKPDQIEESGSAAASETPESAQIEEDKSATNAELSEPAKVEEAGSVAEPESVESVQTEKVMPITEPESAEAKKDTESESVNRTEPVESVKIKEPGSVTTSETTGPVKHKTTDLLPTGTNPAVRR